MTENNDRLRHKFHFIFNGDGFFWSTPDEKAKLICRTANRDFNTVAEIVKWNDYVDKHYKGKNKVKYYFCIETESDKSVFLYDFTGKRPKVCKDKEMTEKAFEGKLPLFKLRGEKEDEL
ncbi:hypothetical protein LBJG_00889 [Lactobacillus jensenii 1153]|jgi:hypothetical protein|uniref:hypothetical protein n=1 Tax=Lactobacillus jensenii TaxID=109790 RepID=UPI0001A44E64|nr:hypothetical protein [Lactobacillus jensenii]EEQ24701.1 hypothetical protein LACJE0001_0530 [Lactobacillus jensenii 269-3]EEQ68461.1 hypothetical protein LBJG_00889 [Lactobacillus jensenii 1153]DAX31972.1 MAG TPA: hypothetical protein [Caudoviricetes sp.]